MVLWCEDEANDDDNGDNYDDIFEFIFKLIQDTISVIGDFAEALQLNARDKMTSKHSKLDKKKNHYNNYIGNGSNSYSGGGGGYVKESVTAQSRFDYTSFMWHFMLLCAYLYDSNAYLYDK